MTLSEISIRRPVFAWMLMAGLILFGWISFQRMGISQLPDVDFPVLNVSINYEGAAPEVIESDVVDIIEDAVMTVQGIRNVSSSSRYGSANITLEFNLDRSIDTALQEVQTKIAQAQRMLPRNLDAPVITKTNPEDQPILWMTASSKTLSPRELNRYVRDQLKDRFTTLPGVGEVFLGGYVDPAIRIWVTSDKLQRYELSVNDIINTVKTEHLELPAGQIETERREYDVRTLGEAATLQQLEGLVISERGGRPNYAATPLKQVVRLEEGLAEVRRVSRFNGQPAVGIGIRKQRGSNAVEVAKVVRKQLETLQGTLPGDLELKINFDSTRFIEESVGELTFTLILSAILTGIVCWLFLGSWSSTVNVLMAIPTSIVGTFIVLALMNFTLNTFTLLGLTLAIGIVVDDAIMILENIVRHKEMGKNRLEAAIAGSKEITFAAIAATIAIAAIFLPVVFMRGVIGKFFFQFGVTLTVSVGLSLLEALTLTPMRCSQFLETAHRTKGVGAWMDRTFDRLATLYGEWLRMALDRRKLVLIGSVVFLIATFASVKGVGKEFVPAQDQGRFMMRMQTPVDSSLEYTDGKFREVEKLLIARPEIDRVYTAVGGFGGGEVNSGIMFITLKEKRARGKNPKTGRIWTQQELMEEYRTLLKQVPDAKVFALDLSMRGFTASRGYPIEFSVRGSEWEKLASSSEQIKIKMEQSGLMSDVDWDYKLGKPEIQIIPDRNKANARGVSIRAISEVINALVGGVNVGKYESGGRRYDIRLRLEKQERSRADQIGKLYVRNNRGELVRLSDVVSISEKPSLSQINRHNRERAISIFANMKPGKSQSDAVAFIQKTGKEVLPSDQKLVMSGSAETFKESFRDLIFALVLGVAVAYMVLASQFNSFIDPVSVLLAMPFSISGAFLALLITGQTLNIYSFIGLILLMGIVKKNSILLVDFTNQALEHGHGRKSVPEALIEACPMRLRAILMTSFATIAGAIPPALAIGPGAETRIPMAVTVIGGVLVSTILTLFVVPCAYLVFSRFQKRGHEVPPAMAGGALTILVFVASMMGSAPTAHAAVSQQAPLSLSEAVNEALSHQPQVEQARERLSQADADVRRTWSSVLPTISAQATAATRKDPVIFTNARFAGQGYNFYTASLQATQPLIVFGLFAGADVTAKNRDIARFDLEVVERDTAVNVIQSFFQVLLNQRNLETLRAVEKIQKDSVTTTQRRQAIGRGQLIDLLQAKTQLALIQPKIEQAESGLQVSALQLATLLGREEPQVLSLRGTLLPPDPKQVDEYFRGQVSKIPEFEQVKVRREQIQSQKDASLGQYLPSLQFSGSLTRNTFRRADMLNSAADSYNATLTLNIPLFNGLSSIYEKQSFNSQARQLAFQEEQLRQNLSLAQVQAREALQVARRKIEISTKAQELAKASLEEAKRNYRLATIDFLQFLQVQQAFAEAENALDQARFEYLQALAQGARAMGIGLPSLVNLLNGAGA
jgi:HAE1 family hydrophobic/amphiphilic exporter-1